MGFEMKIRRNNYCNFKCFSYQQVLNDTSIPAFIQNTGLQQIKIQKNGGTPQFRKYSINQFGRYVGSGGSPLSNF